MGVVHVIEGRKELTEETVAPFFNAEHFVKFADGDLHTDSRQKADKDGAREEIG